MKKQKQTMINKNVELKQINQSVYDIRVVSTKLNDLFKRWGGRVNVKISAPEEKGTEKQNRALHALLKEYYKTGYHSAPEGMTLKEFKIFIKYNYGPVYIINIDVDNVVKIPKSWSDYTKNERRDLISSLISEIKQTGAYVDFKKIREIIDEMERENEN